MKIITKTKKLNFRTKPIGATAVEYMIMLILIALFIIGIMRVFGDTISNKVARASGGIETMSDQSGSGSGVGGEAGGGKAGSGGSGNGVAGNAKGNGGKGNGKGGKSGSAANGSGKGSGKNGASGSGGKGGGSKGGSGTGEDKLKGGKQMANGSGGGETEEEEESGPGINPMILLIAMGLLGLLIYVMTANKKGS